MATGLFGGACAELHTVYVYDRGGERRIGQILDVSSVRWTRDRDGISEALIRIEGKACSAQADFLAGIEPKRAEIVIFRGDSRVWEGPVWRVGWHSSYVEINAHDVFQYVMETPLSQKYSNAYPNITEATTRVNTILQYEMQRWETLDPPVNILPHLEIHHFPNEAQTTAVTLPYESTVGEHIAHLAHYGGIDYTCVGRSIHVWDVSRDLGRTRMLTEADFFSEVVVTAYGADQASYAYVIGQDGKYGSAQAASMYRNYYGPWTKILTAYGEGGSEGPTQSELDSQALRNVSGRNPIPVEVRVPDNSGIRLDETLTIDDLVPGVQVPLLATLNARQLSQMQKIDHVTVQEGPTGETVQVTLTPTTKPDEDEEP